MAIAYDNVSPDTVGSAVTSVTSSAWSIAAGADRILVGFLASVDASPAAHSGMKWGGAGGTALTQVGSTYSAGLYTRLSAWRLIAPTAASQTLYGNVAASQGYLAAAGLSYSGVDQTTPTGTTATNSGSVTNSFGFDATVTIATAVNDVVLACFVIVDGNGSTPLMTPNGTPASTGRYDNESAIYSIQAQEVVATGTSTTVSCNIAPTASNITGDWGAFALILNPVAGAFKPRMTLLGAG